MNRADPVPASFAVPPAVRDLPETLPALAAVHRLAAEEIEELATRWSAAAEALAAADPADPQLRTFDRLGRAAARMREIAVARTQAHTCPVCGFAGLDRPPYLAFDGMPEHPVAPPYAVHFGDPSGERCPRCGYGFGLDDHPAGVGEPVTFEQWRRRWVARGRPWADASRRPCTG